MSKNSKWNRLKKKLSKSEKVANAPKRGSRRKQCKSNKKLQRKSRRVRINCTICEDSSHGVLKFLKCGHAFHRKCFQLWLKNSTHNCPNCAKDLPSNSGFDLKFNLDTSHDSVTMIDIQAPGELLSQIPDMDNPNIDIVNPSPNSSSSIINFDNPEDRPDSVASTLSSTMGDDRTSLDPDDDSFPNSDDSNIELEYNETRNNTGNILSSIVDGHVPNKLCGTITNPYNLSIDLDNSTPNFDNHETRPDSVDYILSSTMESNGPIIDPNNDPSSNLHTSDIESDILETRNAVSSLFSSMADCHLLNKPCRNNTNPDNLNINLDNPSPNLDNPETGPNSDVNIQSSMMDGDGSILNTVDSTCSNMNSSNRESDFETSEAVVNLLRNMRDDQLLSMPCSSIPYPHNLSMDLADSFADSDNSNMDLKYTSNLSSSSINSEDNMHQQLSNLETIPDSSVYHRPLVLRIPKIITHHQNENIDILDHSSPNLDNNLDNSNIDLDNSRHQRRSPRIPRRPASLRLRSPSTPLETQPLPVEEILSIMTAPVPPGPLEPIIDLDDLNINSVDSDSNTNNPDSDIDDSRHLLRSNTETRRDLSANQHPVMLHNPQRVSHRRNAILEDQTNDLRDYLNRNWSGINEDNSCFDLANLRIGFNHQLTNLQHPTTDADDQSFDLNHSIRDSGNPYFNEDSLTKELPHGYCDLDNPSVEVPVIFIPAPCYRCQHVSNDQSMYSEGNITRRILWDDEEFRKQIRILKILLERRRFTLSAMNSPADLNI